MMQKDTFFFWTPDISTEMKQNSTKNMILRQLKEIKAKIEQKSINNIKLSFEGTSTRADRQNASYVCTTSDMFLICFLP